MEDRDLELYFHFDEWDLGANSLGNITPKQLQQLKKDEQRTVNILLVIALIVVGTCLSSIVPIALIAAVALFYFLGWNIWLLVAGVLLLTIVVLIGGFFIYRAIRSATSRQTFTLQKTQGPVNIVKDRHTDSHQHSYEVHELHVGGVRFSMDADVADHLMQGDNYIIYYAMPGETILSVERLPKTG